MRKNQPHLFQNKGIKECSSDILASIVLMSPKQKLKQLAICILVTAGLTLILFSYLSHYAKCPNEGCVCKLALWASVSTLAANHSIVDCSWIQSTDWIPAYIFRAWPSLPSVHRAGWGVSFRGEAEWGCFCITPPLAELTDLTDATPQETKWIIFFFTIYKLR